MTISSRRRGRSVSEDMLGCDADPPVENEKLKVFFRQDEFPLNEAYHEATWKQSLQFFLEVKLVERIRDFCATLAAKHKHRVSSYTEREIAAGWRSFSALIDLRIWKFS